MADTADGLWRGGERRPVRRLMAAMLLAPLLLAVILTLLEFIATGATERNALSVYSHTGIAALVFAGTMATFTVTFGATGVGLLWVASQRRLSAWLAMGTALGVVFAMGHGILTHGLINDLHVLFAGAIGAVLFALIRWIAGIRT